MAEMIRELEEELRQQLRDLEGGCRISRGSSIGGCPKLELPGADFVKKAAPRRWMDGGRKGFLQCAHSIILDADRCPIRSTISSQG